MQEEVTEIKGENLELKVEGEYFPNTLLELAVKNNANIDVLERLMALQERWNAQKSKEKFFQALVDFQNIVPGVRKSKTAMFDGKPQYKYADLSDVINTIKDSAHKTGIAFQWKIEDTKEIISVTCFITAHGHTEATKMSSSPDGSGKKNDIQARGSAIEYMKRYTLAGALGLSISEDNDGGNPVSDPTIEEIKESAEKTTNQADLKAFYKSLPKKLQNNPAVKEILKNHENFIKKANEQE